MVTLTSLPPLAIPSGQDFLKDLNKSQQEAVLHDAGPLLIIAGAGTGKTTVITRRIARLINEKRARPDQILALTFTDKAAQEMEERVDMLVPYGYTDVEVSTFHAFGDRLLRDHALALGMNPDYRVLSRAEQIVFLRDHLFELPLHHYRPLGNPTKYLQALVTLFSRIQDEDVSAEAYAAFAATLATAPPPEMTAEEGRAFAEQQQELAAAFQKYHELKGKFGYIDFADQVNLVLKLLRTKPLIRRAIQERFHYILVDEFQDTNFAQLQLIHTLTEKNKNITVVADDDQSIYRFRGAAISNVLNFLTTYEAATTIVLTHNYRSTQVILDTAYRLIQHNNPDRLEVRQGIHKKLQGKVRGGKTVEHRHFDTLESEADFVAQTIQEKAAAGTPYREMAILVRANNDADPFLRALAMQGIPYHFSGSRGLFSFPEVKRLLSLLHVLYNFYDSVPLYHLATSEWYQFPPVDLQKCLIYAQRHNSTLYAILSSLEEIPELTGISAESKVTAQKLINDITNYVALATDRPTGEVLYTYLKESSYLQQLVQIKSAENEAKLQNIAKFFEKVRTYASLLTHDRISHFVPYLDSLIEAGEDPAAGDADFDNDAVPVMTIHKAKGLEFKIVFLVSLVHNKFPSRKRRDPIELPEALIRETLPSGDFHLQEERRLFYVGMTRAKEALYFTSARDYGGKLARKVSPFVLEALDQPRADQSIFKASALTAIERFAPPLANTTSLGEPLAETTLLHLSHYQIDDYLTCPLKYKYIHILRIPLLAHHSIIYGKALHDAVEAYHRATIQGKPMDEAGLLAAFERAWHSEGFLSRDHEEQRFAEGKATLLRFHDHESTLEAKPTYIEKEFTILSGKNRIKGRFDRIDIRDEKVFIIDYKSSPVKGQKEADQKAKSSLQLDMYALAYFKMFKKIPEVVQLYFLESGLIGSAQKSTADLEKTEQKIEVVARGIRSGNFEAAPSYLACSYCPFQQMCPSATPN